MPEYRCPICRKPSDLSFPSFPFCSRRCKLLDLGTWASDGYRIAGTLNGDDLDLDGFGELPSSGPAREEEAPE